jgi:lysophospholipase L1-like esterase
MKKTTTAILCVILAMACLLTACAGKSENEAKVYKDGMFTDVPASSPYRDYVAAVYEMGLMGASDDKQNAFGANESVSVGDAVSYADRLHSLYTGDKAKFEQSDPWYQVYIDYAVTDGILEAAPEDCTQYITRAAFAQLISKCMPATSLPTINSVEDGSIPDVTMDSTYADSIYLLYRAGVFTGETDGSFRPEENISRAEAAQAVARMAASSMRGKVTLAKPEVFSPDLTEQASKDDEYFKDAAILGNSLVEGLKMYSKLTTINYYSGTSMSVVSASKTELPQLLGTKYAKIYIELGINEIGEDVGTFKNDYGAMIDKIKSAEPDAKVYIMAILPVSKTKSSDGGNYTIERVKEYNSALYELATEKECYYLDDFAALVGSDGYLAADQTWDGVHLTPATYTVWENYIRTHYAAEK